MTDLKTTEAERKRVEEAARDFLKIGVEPFVLRLLADFRTLQEQCREATPLIEGAARGKSVMIAAGEWTRRHQSRQQPAKDTDDHRPSKAGETR